MPSGNTLGDARGAAVTTVIAAPGYPGEPATGGEVSIPADLEAAEDVIVFHAGTSRAADGRLLASGGRVLAVTAVAPTVAEAAERSRAAALAVGFKGKQFRRDIGWREIARQR
jgi:phosphoribosylamine--glycine ligase